MLIYFYSIWIVWAEVFLLQKKSWQEERELVAGDPTEGIWVGNHGVGWLSWVERKQQKSRGYARRAWLQHPTSPQGQI